MEKYCRRVREIIELARDLESSPEAERRTRIERIRLETHDLLDEFEELLEEIQHGQEPHALLSVEEIQEFIALLYDAAVSTEAIARAFAIAAVLR